MAGRIIVPSPDDAALVARDAVLPGLATLFDDTVFAEVLRELCPEATIQATRSEYVRYKPGVSCLMKYRVETDFGNTDVYARAHPRDQTDKMGKAIEQKRVAGPFGFGAAVIADLALVIYEFPNDHEMPVLRRIGDKDEQPRLLERVLPQRPDLWNAHPVGLRYKPERRYAARLDNDEGQPVAILKICTESEFERAYTNSRQFVSEGPLHIPPRIGRSRRHNILVYDWLKGESSLAAAADSGAAEELGRRIGEALAILHGQEPELKLEYAEETLMRQVRDAVAAISVVMPQSYERAVALGQRITSVLEMITLRRESIHGDFSLDQTLLFKDGIAVVDFDRAGHGDGAIDLGRFRANLTMLNLMGEMDKARAEGLGRGLLEEYATRTGRDDSDRVRIFEAVALMQLAVEPFRWRHPEWRKIAESILDQVDALLGNGRDGRPTLQGDGRPTGIVDHLSAICLSREQASSLNLSVGSLALRRSWPRSADHLHLEFISESGDIVPGQWMREGDKLEEISQKTRKACPQGKCAIISHEELSILLQPHGADRRLPGLHRTLAEPGHTLLVHRPERRAVVRRDAGKDFQFLKFLRPDRTEEIAEAGRWIEQAANRPFAVPQLLDCNSEMGIITLSQLPGESLFDRLHHRGAGKIWESVGKALRWMHDSPPPNDIPVHDAGRECGVIDRWTDLCGALTAIDPSRLHELASAVKHALRRDGGEPDALLHRDFYDKQIFVTEKGELGMLDFDTLARGEAALDIANLLGHLELRSRQNRCPAESAQEASAAFLRGYDPDDSVRDRIPAYLNATRIRLACVYSFRPEWADLIPSLLDSIGA